MAHPRRTRALLSALLVALTAATACSGGDAEERSPAAAAGPVAWVSSPSDPGRRLLEIGPSRAAPTLAVSVDPESRRQEWWGTGGALSDAAAGLLADDADAVRLLLDPDSPDGARLNLLRLPLSSTDFSPEAWTWGWDGERATPHPRAESAAALVAGPLRAVRPDLAVVAAPWTAPVALKDGASVRGGALADGREEEWAAVLASQAGWLLDHGVPLRAVSVGNEPGYSADYPTMTMSDDQLAATGAALAPRLDDLGVDLWALDDNWAARDRADAVLAAAPDRFDAVAFHCYAGEAAQMAGLAVPSLVTECTGTTGSWADTFAWDARHLVADAVAAGSSGLLLWNLALDPDHGPVDPGSALGCRDCRGLVTVGPSGVAPEPEFYVLAHLSRVADPGARVVGSRADPGLAVAAFVNPDGSLGVFGHNDTGSAQTVAVRVGGRTASYDVGEGELFGYRSAT